MPEEVQPTAVDANGKPFAVGDHIIILSVDSCSRGLPHEDQERLRGVVGHRREIVDIDRFGFVWLSFSDDEPGADFCLAPAELAIG